MEIDGVGTGFAIFELNYNNIHFYTLKRDVPCTV